MSDLHRKTDEFVVRTSDGREYTVSEFTPQHEVRDGESTTDLGIKNSPRLETTGGLQVVHRGGDEYDILTPGGRVVAKRE